MWYVSSNRDESRYDDPDRFDVERNPEHQAFGAGGRHFCLGAALARLELRILFEETLKRYPEIELAGQPGVRRDPVREPAQHPAGRASAPARRSASAALPPHPARHARVAVARPLAAMPAERTFTVACDGERALGAASGDRRARGTPARRGRARAAPRLAGFSDERSSIGGSAAVGLRAVHRASIAVGIAGSSARGGWMAPVAGGRATERRWLDASVSGRTHGRLDRAPASAAHVTVAG